MITYLNAIEDTIKVATVGNWSHSFTGTHGNNVFLSGANKNQTGTVTVVIKKNGAVLSSAANSSAYAIATAQGVIPE